MDLQPNKTDAIIKPITNTRISASEWNQLVGSCMAFITAAGFTPDGADNQQFLNAFIKIAQDMGAIGANVSLSNVTDVGTSTGASWAMPSTVSTALTLGSSGTEYTAPANGYVVLAVTSGLSYFYLVNTTTGLASGVTNAGAGYTCRLFIPVQKDDKFEVDYQLTPDAYSFTFIYAEGSKTEAQ